MEEKLNRIGIYNNDLISELVEFANEDYNFRNYIEFISFDRFLENLEDVKVPISASQIRKLNRSKYNNQQQSTCSICQNDFIANDDIVILPCHHIFHNHCIIPWLSEYHHICPYCKVDIRPIL